MAIRGMAKADNKEKHYFHGFEAGSDSFVQVNIEDLEIDASQIADSTAVQVLSEIQNVIKNEDYSDFDAMEEIICIFEKYNIDYGFRHDF